jgi:hypothetical protein
MPKALQEVHGSQRQETPSLICRTPQHRKAREKMNAEKIIEAVCVALLLAPFWMACPFTWESAQREARREWKAGNKSANVTRRWYGWVVVHKNSLQNTPAQE